ncbi:hypothetical protein CRE_01403 [Caenorhabditis remanei]|uniref:Uncharacterized protein n=1 Tax=Caenorhabditis remanei TaxID=31234 RepID=E3NHW0_CAERE|nr:hypothetical protein CRE_01403 [Caenorhabditis remanei]
MASSLEKVEFDDKTHRKRSRNKENYHLGSVLHENDAIVSPLKYNQKSSAEVDDEEEGEDEEELKICT